MSKFNDYIGQKINKLEILSISDERPHNKTYFICRCECGTTRRVNASKLIRGIVKGCQKCKNKGVDNLNWSGFEGITGTFWYQIKDNANHKTKKLEFSITQQYAWDLYCKQEKKCALSGLSIPLPKDSYTRSEASLDRIDSSVGYTEGNVQWVHKDVNRMKTDLEQEKFIRLCKLIAQSN